MPQPVIVGSVRIRYDNNGDPEFVPGTNSGAFVSVARVGVSLGALEVTTVQAMPVDANAQGTVEGTVPGNVSFNTPPDANTLSINTVDGTNAGADLPLGLRLTRVQKG